VGDYAAPGGMVSPLLFNGGTAQGDGHCVLRANGAETRDERGRAEGGAEGRGRATHGPRGGLPQEADRAGGPLQD
jgi:hypothetical protein